MQHESLTGPCENCTVECDVTNGVGLSDQRQKTEALNGRAPSGNEPTAALTDQRGSRSLKPVTEAHRHFHFGGKAACSEEELKGQYTL